ncbi:sacsin N-terminal ATP-binding-like domain-containing protein [Methylocaldum sp. GT1BB]|jgi:hypothetical protein|uniref:sacsin N-terminal ATP-binding-like domain-containing protein n=1 Tax=Methylocaldum sp. GT1BB TaxID=3438963 RepID=UPI003DA12C6E
MPGLRQHLVTEIARTLRDRYHSGFPILKELIQNADDAEATRIVFGHHSGFGSSTQHPLLAGPALWIFNNGKFKKSDATAIEYFGINTKAGDDSAIGKFGLGMKSVFHLCEAFFYVAFDGSETHKRILNPWYSDIAEEQFHNAWEDVSDSDWQKFQEIGEKYVDQGDSWFLMWIPLRRKSHKQSDLGGEVGAIVERYPGDSGSDELHFLRNGDLEKALGFVLPLLKHLRVIEHVGDATFPGFTIRIESNENLRLDHKTPNVKVSGRVVGSSSTKSVIKFSGVQRAPADDDPAATYFERLRALESWPKSFRLNEQRQFEQVPDKSRAEAAVALQAIEGDAGRLSLDWAVFLPVEEGQNTYSVPIPGTSRQYRFILHGQFFVDAGRRGINGYGKLAEPPLSNFDDLDEAALAITWNQSVAQGLVLPNILVVLADFVTNNRLSDDDITQLTEALRSARSDSGQSFYSKYQTYICSGQSWACVMSAEGRQWKLINSRSGLKLLPLPKAPNDHPQRPWMVLPGLSNLPDAVFYDATKPCLSLSDSTWDEASLARALELPQRIDLMRAFGTSTGLDYLASFLEQEERRYVSVSSIQDALFTLLRRVFRTIPLKEIRKNRERFRTVLRFLQPRRRVAIGTIDPAAKNAIPSAVFDQLFTVDTATLLLPLDLDPGDGHASVAEPSENDLSAWLKVVDGLVGSETGSNSVDHLLGTAEYLLGLRKNEVERAGFLRVNPNLRIIRAVCPRTRKQVASSLTALMDLHRRGNLFLFSGGTSAQDRLGLVPLIARAVPSESILVIDSATGKILREAGAGVILQSGSPTDALRCIAINGGTKYLGSEGDRLALIKKAHEGMRDIETRRGLRYLLHGASEHFHDDASPLWIEPSHSSSPWIKTWKMVDQAHWNVLSSILANSIPRVQWEEIGIKPVDRSQVIARLQQIEDFSVIDSSDFSDVERDAILGAIDDRHLWLSLPLHRDVHGDLGPIDEWCFLRTDHRVPPELQERCRIIEISDDSAHSNNQRRFLHGFDANAAIRITLDLDRPLEIWHLILDQLCHASCNDLAPKLLDQLRSAKWVPLRNGGIVRPMDVIDVPDLVDDIDRLASKADYCFAGVSAINEAFRSHRGFASVECLFSCGPVAAEQLGLLLGEVEDYYVGEIRALQVSDLRELLPFVCSLDLPGWQVVRRCLEVFDPDLVCTEILPNIRRKIPIEKIAFALKELSSHSQDESGQIAAFSLYLELLPIYPREDAIRLLRSLDLLSKAGSWRPSTELCDGGAELEGSHVLDHRLSEILGDLIVRVGGQGDQAAVSECELAGFELMVDAAPGVLAHYFDDWEPLVRSPTVGAFISVLGTRFRSLSEKWLQPHSVDWVYDSLNWHVPGERSDGVRGWMQDTSAKEAFGLLRVGIREIHGDSIEVSNLFADSIQVPLTSTVENLVAGGLYWRGGYSVEVRIRKIPNLAELPPAELSQILQNSTTFILREAYAQNHADLRGLWEQLEESDQLELSVARALILDNLPIVLRQIGAQKKNPDLAAALKRYNKARRAKTEAEQSRNEVHHEADGSNTALRRSLDELADILKREDVQADVLEAVRAKLRDYQYDPSGILFELFQNADDASIELNRLSQRFRCGMDEDDIADKFIVDIRDNVVRACHWGRPINYCPPVEEEHADDFRCDLEKMLILSASDKSSSSGVTGKFGLGFKSVLLATDSPRVLSGDLRFEIVGGVLPQPWGGSKEAAEVLHKWSSHIRRRGTVTEIPIDDESLRDQVLKRFTVLSGLQAIFGRAIHEIRISGIAAPVPRGHWKVRSKIGMFEVGTADIPTSTGWSEANLLVFRGESGTVVLKLGSRSVDKFDGRVPPFWVTAPTRESESVGFIVNAGFEVDAGRSRLASHSSHNYELAKQLGRELGGAFSDIYRAGQSDWDAVRNQFDLASDVSQAEFWASLWRAFQQRREAIEAEVYRLAHEIVSEAFGKLMKASGFIPNGIPGDFGGFVASTLPLAAFPTAWLRSEAVLRALSKWPAFLNRYPKSHWIADDLAGFAAELCCQELQKLSIKSIIASIDDQRCDAVTAACLQQITAVLLVEASWLEQAEARTSFVSLRFLSQAGSWSPASSLVSSGSNDPDERLITGFAPKRHLLVNEYVDDSLFFFCQCRSESNLAADVIAQFVLQADTDEARRGALLYLGKGEQARDVAQLLRNRISDTWLEKLDDHLGLLRELPDEVKLETLFRLRPESITYQAPMFSETDETDAIDGAEKLARIASWWESEGRDRHLLRYEQQFWPANVSRDFSADPADRRAWMTLFGLGLTQRMGRVKDSQHRGFIQSLDSKGWWNVFCNVKPQEDSAAWLKVLQEYGEKQIDSEEYGLWMDNFARLYRVARWLDVYVHVFRTIDQRSGSEFASLLSPGVDPIFQGDEESSAPSLERSLKNGQHLVIRELLRTGILCSDHAQRRAFIPSWSVRQFFVDLGFDEPQSSEEIYQILSDAIDDPTFGGDYDIPLRIVAHGEVQLATILMR